MNAVYGNKFGWERPNWFAPAGAKPEDPPSFERGVAFYAIGLEHQAVRERVGVVDMSSFSKFEVAGPGALALLQNLAVNDLDRPVGTIVYTQLCNARGGIEADVTITRLAQDRFYFVTGSALGVRDRSTIERAAPADGSVDDPRSHVARNRCSRSSARARATCSAAITDAPLGNADFPYMSARTIDVGCAPVLALRVSYVGELGYELHVPTEYALYLYDALWRAGERVRNRQRRLPRGQQPAPRKAVPRLGLGHHARLQPVRGGARLLRGVEQGRVRGARGARRGQGRRARGRSSRGSMRPAT